MPSPGIDCDRRLTAGNVVHTLGGKQAGLLGRHPRGKQPLERMSWPFDIHAGR